MGIKNKLLSDNFVLDMTKKDTYFKIIVLTVLVCWALAYT